MPSAEPSQQWRAAESFLVDGLRDGRFESVPLGAAIVYEDPLSGGPIRGRNDLAAYAAAHRSWLRDVLVDRSVEQSGSAVLRGRFVTEGAREIAFAAWFDFESAQVIHVRLFWGARPHTR